MPHQAQLRRACRPGRGDFPRFRRERDIYRGTPADVRGQGGQPAVLQGGDGGNRELHPPSRRVPVEQVPPGEPHAPLQGPPVRRTGV